MADVKRGWDFVVEFPDIISISTQHGPFFRMYRDELFHQHCLSRITKIPFQPIEPAAFEARRKSSSCDLVHLSFLPVLDFQYMSRLPEIQRVHPLTPSPSLLGQQHHNSHPDSNSQPPVKPNVFKMSNEKPSWMQNDEEDEEDDVDETVNPPPPPLLTQCNLTTQQNYIQQKDAVLFAIDVSASMLASPPPSNDKKADTDSPTIAALKCAYQIMQQRVISNPKDMMGVMLFGTEKTKFLEEAETGSLAYPHCYILTDLDIPGAADIKTLKALIEEEDEAADLLQPSSDPVSMANLLFCANQIFMTKAPNFNSRRLFIITDNDDPHSKDKAFASQATVRAKDLYDLDVTIELFPISHPGHEFDRSKFYDVGFFHSIILFVHANTTRISCMPIQKNPKM